MRHRQAAHRLTGTVTEQGFWATGRVWSRAVVENCAKANGRTIVGEGDAGTPLVLLDVFSSEKRVGKRASQRRRALLLS